MTIDLYVYMMAIKEIESACGDSCVLFDKLDNVTL